MKNHFYISFCLAAFMAFSLFSCDEIEGPYKETNQTDTTTTGEVVKKVLLEEFTGHKCPNCPDGAASAHALKELYGDKLVIVAIHSGYFATTTSPDFTYDFRTPEGEDLYSSFGVTTNPIGMINRKEFSGKKLQTHTSWSTYVSGEMDVEPVIGLKIENTYDADTRALSVKVTAKTVTALTENYKICVQITENGIVKPQQSSSGINQNYEHDHVLRQTLNTAWGEDIALSGASGTEAIKNYNITLNNDWVAENCSVVAYIYNSANFEVVQAEEISIINP
ncbi:MAG: Omp28 family outer membrane lipoprotein [Bacteroidales bacterium]|nr:Omp28 family outer membrane lipoprotein [Bacteroidales bacterium]